MPSEIDDGEQEAGVSIGAKSENSETDDDVASTKHHGAPEQGPR